jgi:hypothetical protein
MIGFLWRSARGYRLTPWRSPYLRWRIETYWGLHADRISPAEFRGFVWNHRKELLRFLRWGAQMESMAESAARATSAAPRPIPYLPEPARSSNPADSA